jgi:SAM-dependent methyltransferase
VPQELDDLAEKWDSLGREDPLWSILTDPAKAGGRGSPQEFFATGGAEIDAAFTQLDQLGVEVARGSALDFGCGVGRLTQALASRFDRVLGLDVAASMIELAKSHDQSGGNVTYRVNQSPRLEGVADASFDFIYTNIVLQHIPPDLSAGYIAEFARTLRPAGVAVFQVPSHPRTLRGRLKSVLKRRLPAVFALMKATYRRRRAATMDMYGVARERVEAIAHNGGCEVLAVIQDDAAGDEWLSYRYVTRKNARTEAP